MLHFVELEPVDDGERVFLPLDHAALQRVVKPVGVDGDGLGAQRFEAIVEHLACRHSELHAFQIGDAAHRMCRRGDIAEAVLETGLGKHIDAFGLGFLPQQIAEIPVQGAIDLRIVPESKGHPLDVRDGNHFAEDSAHQRVELQLARDEHVARLGIAARNIVVAREGFDPDLAAGFLFDRGPHLVQPLVQRGPGGLVVELPHLDGCSRARGPRRNHRGSRCRADAKREASPGNGLHVRLPVWRENRRIGTCAQCAVNRYEPAPIRDGCRSSPALPARPPARHPPAPRRRLRSERPRGLRAFPPQPWRCRTCCRRCRGSPS